MDKKELLNELAKTFNSLSSSKNINLFIQICEGPKLTDELETDLSRMPLNRRLNILKDAGLINRIVVGKNKNMLENSITKNAKPFIKLVKLINY
jgi:DNA-binding HxlR family transcriptional regulator